jgi:phosphate transport system substrate-binding protein
LKITRMHAALAFAAACAFSAATMAAQATKIDEKLRPYQSVKGVSGTIKSMGSDTMVNLMTNWAEGFKRSYPNVQIEVEGKGSATAPAALIAGTATFGPMSRAMKAKEIDDFEKQFGYKPTALPGAIDMLAVYVHKDNPLAGLSLQQVDAIFSKTRKGGLQNDVVTWGQLGLTGEWADKPISLYGRNSVSGTYGYFKDHALFNGDFKDSVKEQAGSSSVVQAIASDKYAIGYSGIGYKTADVRALPLGREVGAAPIEPKPENAYSGDYPLARMLYVYVNHKPGTNIDPLRGEFVRYMFSRDGQSDVVKDGYLPITAEVAAEALASVGLRPAAIEAGMQR